MKINRSFLSNKNFDKLFLLVDRAFWFVRRAFFIDNPSKYICQTEHLSVDPEPCLIAQSRCCGNKKI